MTTVPAGVVTSAVSSMIGGFTFPSVTNTGVPCTTPAMAGMNAAMLSGAASAYGVTPSGVPAMYGYGYPAAVCAAPAASAPVVRHVGGGVPGIKDISNKPPVMKSSFDLYAVQLQTYLTRLGLWGIIDGGDVRPLFDVNRQAEFDARDNATREAILRGVPEGDAEMIYHEKSAREMWIRFENKQTKREFANYIFAREQLYSNKYTREMDMSGWLREMQLQRRELSHYGKVISDEEFAEILLANVTRTHREVVRQFSRHYAALALPGAQQMTPTAAQVMNALLAEEDLDEKVGEEMPRSSISSAKKTSNSQGKQSNGNSGNGNAGKGKKQRGRGRYKAKGKDPPGKSGSGKKNDGCWNCGELDHIRAHCPNPKKTDGPQIQKQFAGMEAKRFQNKKGGDGGGAMRTIDALTQRKIGATVVDPRRRKPRVMEWVLDTATDVQVCTDLNLLDNSRTGREHFFLDFDGQPKGERMIGDVSLQVMNVTSQIRESSSDQARNKPGRAESGGHLHCVTSC
ncbi:hypothetical protein PF008_g30417 [Phytophthora fragariae]|uniref:CCHC-type domain-containing protein n=1 Tax=Phytophthora fragariae TaxID=53985 RepID=A0A6G0Q698_9STRA|nr:hypothetical protein PF008_g30417 [Phytophthora fragariae]